MTEGKQEATELRASTDTSRPKKRQRNKAATRRAIIDAGRRLFGRHGYSATALSDIVAAADVTTGALYHHFGDKKGLFRAVAENVEEDILAEITAILLPDMTPWAMLSDGMSITLDICARPDLQRIIFTDAPMVIGMREWRQVELKYGFGLMRQTLQGLADQGELSAPSVDMTAQILLGALIEAAHAIALAKDRAAALDDAKATLQTMIQALRKR